MSLKTKLYEHQKIAIEKIEGLKVAALFMDMGTGKTRTTLEYIEIKSYKIDKVVWLCPVRTKYNLRNDIKKHSDYECGFIEDYKKEFICICGIESVSQSDNVYFKLNDICTDKTLIVVDESHMIKNFFAKRSQRIHSLKSKYRLALTGTPTPNGIIDYFSQFYFLSPKILGYNSYYSFAANHIEYSDKYPGMINRTHDTEYITKKINPYIYQVKKSECLDLPDKTYSERTCYLSKRASREYDYIKDYYLERINYDEFNSTIIFQMFNYVHRVCSGFYSKGHKKTRRFVDYEKIKLLKETLEEIDLKENRVVIFYRYNSDRAMIKKHIEVKAEINGNVSLKQQEESIRAIHNEESIILININSGSVGLNLQCCNYAIFYNNTFDYAKRIQAEDRLHRIGQYRNVHIIDLVMYGTIDERILENLRNKKSTIKELEKEIRSIKDDKEKAKEFINRMLKG